MNPDLTLEFTSGARLDLEAVDELANELYGLDRNFTIELMPAKELREITGRKHADGAHWSITGDNWHSIALADHLTAQEAAGTLGHELGHSAHAQAAVSHRTVTEADVAAYDADAERIADTYEKAFARTIFHRAFLDGRGGASSSGGRSNNGVASSPPAAETSTPGPAEWPVPVRYNREGERDALRRLDE